ncbi:DUF2922 domain-containing protein [Virgibacillus soli]|uniref:DUF2922 domain-containing protein n=1 Tax=Paracerasibacillus soli TaxID=480284 RepID=A0ABU5CSU3_9BACI|nr:DUF2922 domain-containing protein [Virgibacillus soli]MDY0409427.1 DUF2922 domain-containing protein [Virgibacillus soli]
MKRLELRFENEEGKIVTYTLDDPAEPVDPEQVNEVMDEIIAENVLFSNGGDLVAKRSARVVEQNIEEIDVMG